MSKLMSVISKYCDIKNITFVQVGSNNGVRGDPIYKLVKRYKWRGILIEPQSDVFESLKSNYTGCGNLIFENVAVHKKKKQVFMYRFVKDSRITSLFRNNRTLKRRSDENILKFKVDAMSLNEILEKYNLLQIDVLQIDAEGYDFGVVKSISLNKYRPRVIIYENCALIEQKKDKLIRRYLRKFGYTTFTKYSKRDIMAVRPK